MKNILLTLSALLLVSCAEKKDQLNVFIWSEYLDASVVADFEKQFNCRVTIDLYEEPETMMAKMLAGGDSSYDIVAPGHRTLPILVNRGMIAPLRKEAIPNLKNIDPRFRKSEFNPDFNYGVPYHWGSVGIFMRKPEGANVDETWGLLFDPDKLPGPFLLMDDLRTTIGIALMYQGHSVNTIDPMALSEAADLLIATKKRARGFEGSVLARNRVMSKEVTASVVYSSEGARGLADDPETTFFVPREGSMIWQDLLSIPAKAPHPELAEKFINFILDPEIGGRNATSNFAASPNKAALEFIDPDQLKNPAIYPPDDVLDRLHYDKDVGDETKLYDELWTQIKSK